MSRYRIRPVGESSWIVERKSFFGWVTFIGDFYLEGAFPTNFPSFQKAKEALDEKCGRLIRQKKHESQRPIYFPGCQDQDFF